MQQDPEVLFDLLHGFQLVGRDFGGEDLSQPVGCGLGGRVAGPQEQHPVRPDLADSTVEAALDLSGRGLSGL